MKKVLLPVIGILLAAWAALTILKRMGGGEGSHPHAALEVGTPIPDLDLVDFRGTARKLSSIGAKVILINFWATWCEACIVEMPSLIRLRNQFKGSGFELVLINLDENPQAVVPPVAQKLGITFEHYVDADQKISDMFDVHGIPLSLVVGSGRKLLLAFPGERDWDAPPVHEQLTAWLKAP